MSDIWGILGIEPTLDASTIKKAYARKLKRHHPEDDPKGYQRLREAYDKALKQAKASVKKVSLPLKKGKEETSVQLENCNVDLREIQEDDETLRPMHFTEFISDAVLRPPIEATLDETEVLQRVSLLEDINSEDVNRCPDIGLLPPVSLVEDMNVKPTEKVTEEQFLQRVEELYSDFFSRIDVENWKLLLNSEIVWNITTRHEISVSLLNFFNDHYFVPSEVWAFLDEQFNWSGQVDAYDSTEIYEIVPLVKEKVLRNNDVCYSQIKKIDGYDYERFLVSREVARDPLTYRSEVYRFYVQYAEMVYPDDPELPIFLGKFYYENGDYEKAEIYFEKAIHRCPGDKEVFVHYLRLQDKIKETLFIKFCKKPWRLDWLRKHRSIQKETKSITKMLADARGEKYYEGIYYAAVIGLVFIAVLIAGCFIMRNIPDTSTVDFDESKTTLLHDVCSGNKL